MAKSYETSIPCRTSRSPISSGVKIECWGLVRMQADSSLTFGTLITPFPPPEGEVAPSPPFCCERGGTLPFPFRGRAEVVGRPRVLDTTTLFLGLFLSSDGGPRRIMGVRISAEEEEDDSEHIGQKMCKTQKENHENKRKKWLPG
ncbi:hypothetical protein ACP275_10G102600 [Erythranthe tilingii]